LFKSAKIQGLSILIIIARGKKILGKSPKYGSGETTPKRILISLLSLSFTRVLSLNRYLKIRMKSLISFQFETSISTGAGAGVGSASGAGAGDGSASGAGAGDFTGARERVTSEN